MAVLLSRGEAEDLTAPFHPSWLSAFEGAEQWYWEDFRTAFPQAFIDMDATARATMLNRVIVGNVSRIDGVRMSDALSFPVQILNADGHYAIARFKLLDATLKPANHPSGQQDSLQDHEFSDDAVAQLTLDGGLATPPTILTVGYQLAQDQLSMVRICVVCWHRDSIRFWYDIDAEPGYSGGTILQLPLPDMPPDETRIVPKRRKDKAEARDAPDNDEA